MKNLHILPTDKPSRLIQAEDNELMLLNELYENTYNINKHIYITSDEEIKDGEWHLHYYESKPVISKSHNGASKVINEKAKRFGYKKIILTTDDQLIKDGVQSIPDEFLEWFVKNPSCESVEVKSLLSNNGNVFFGYKIIIPKEEHKQGSIVEAVKEVISNQLQQVEELRQETLEEAAKKYANKKGDIPTTKLENAIFKQGFIDDAKWQQEDIIEKLEMHILVNEDDWNRNPQAEFRNFIEQFKK